MQQGQTPSQTVGPFFHYGLIFGGEDSLVRDGVRGTRIAIAGCVRDGDGTAVPDALVELWQADADGIYPHPADPRHAAADPNFLGFGRSDTTHPGQTYRFETVKPARAAAPGGGHQAPHACVRIFARGLLTHLTTRLYFSDEPDANAADPVLATIPAERRGTLIAQRAESAEEDVPVYRLDFVLQGDGETVFFEP